MPISLMSSSSVMSLSILPSTRLSTKAWHTSSERPSVLQKALTSRALHVASGLAAAGLVEVDASVTLGDEVVLLGRQGDEEIGADQVADIIGIIPWEVLCSLSHRPPRRYP